MGTGNDNKKNEEKSSTPKIKVRMKDPTAMMKKPFELNGDEVKEVAFTDTVKELLRGKLIVRA